MLYSLLPDDHAVPSEHMTRAVPFDLHQHLLLCDELKRLYVALTRARKRCFLFDSSIERRQPAFDYFSAMGVAEQGLEVQLSATASKAGKSSVSDWLQRAENFRLNRLWRHAERCFLKGGDEASALACGAKRLGQEAAAEAQPAARSAKLREAATAFLQAATLRLDLVNFTRAARVFFLSAESLKDASSSSKVLKGERLVDAGYTVWRGMGRPREAAACFFLAAVCTEQRALYATAGTALRESDDDVPQKAAALGVLRRLETGPGEIGDPALTAALQPGSVEAWLRMQAEEADAQAEAQRGAGGEYRR